ncbi:MAG TPA: GMC oxidoreductase [Devosiaceae bacterium]|nr:GMC oxidoreductase [Devosiaceae bacterium]
MSDDFDDYADVVIVGSGPTGATYARMLADQLPEARILMLEAGPVIAERLGQHLANITDLGLREAAQLASQGPLRGKPYLPMTDQEWQIRQAGGPDLSMLRRPGLFVVGGGSVDGDEFPAAHAAAGVGGMGVHWFGACPTPSESERIPFIERAEMDEALERARTFLKVSNTQFPDSPIAPRLEAALGELFNAGRPGDRLVQPMPMALVRNPNGVFRSGPDAILGSLISEESENFELRPETVVRRIILKGNRAVGVEIWEQTTREVSRVGASTVIVAADSLHTPQLLFASGIRPQALGHYLNEHPQVSIMAEVDGVAPGDPTTSVAGAIGGVLSDTKAVSRITSGVTWVPYLDEQFPFHVQITQVEPASLPPAERALGERKPLVNVSFFLPSDIQYDNCVAFSDTERDWCGRPAMRLRFKMSGRDLERMELARQTLLKVSNAIGRPVEGHQPRTPPNGSSLHYQGTIRMGERDDGKSVCDRNSRVWGFENIYLAGNGLIPTMTAGNPTLTSVALAILGARDIATRQPTRADA